MTALIRSVAGLPRVPLAVLLLVAAVVVGGRLAGVTDGPMAMPVTGPADPAPVAIPGDLVAPVAPGVGAPSVAATAEDLARIRANVTFWGDRFRRDARDFVSATRLAWSSMDLARATGDASHYAAADQALEASLQVHPGYRPALAARGAVLIALHRFPEARDFARSVLADQPDDPSALATLGDATLELGDLAAARGAYERLVAVADGAPGQVRVGRLAYVEGRTTAAVAGATAALVAAGDEGVDTLTLAWYHAHLGEVLLSTGDASGAGQAFDTALALDPASLTALAGRARLAAADGRLDAAIADLDRALAAVPAPELLAKRADLLERRGGSDDARRAADDRATILAIATLTGDAAGVHDRTLAVYLASTGLDPERAVRLAQAEIAVRRDVFGYDALGWALLAAGRADEADAALRSALSVGTRDARVLYHAGMAALAVGDAARARQHLADALAIDPTFDVLAAEQARAALATLP